MNRRTFLKAVGAVLVAPSLPVSKAAPSVLDIDFAIWEMRVMAKYKYVIYRGSRRCGKTELFKKMNFARMYGASDKQIANIIKGEKNDQRRFTTSNHRRFCLLDK